MPAGIACERRVDLISNEITTLVGSGCLGLVQNVKTFCDFS